MSVRAKRSKVWAHFVRVNENSARCNLCQREVASKGGNTSNMTKHLERLHSIKLKECGLFDCYSNTGKVSTPANTKDCSSVAAATGVVPDNKSSHGKVLSSL